MDPITIVLAALAAGAAAGMADTATQAVKDAYAGLKGLIQRRFAGKPEAETALAQYEKKPDVWKAPLQDALQEACVDKDKEIIAAAEHLRELLGKTGTNVVASGDRSVAIGGSVGSTTIITGDHNKVAKD